MYMAGKLSTWLRIRKFGSQNKNDNEINKF